MKTHQRNNGYVILIKTLNRTEFIKASDTYIHIYAPHALFTLKTFLSHLDS